MNRITTRDLEAVYQRINRTVNGREMQPYERTDSDSKLPGDWFRQVPGAYTLSGAYGGYALHRNCDAGPDGESHGVHDVFGCGHMPKRELYDRMQAFLRGYETPNPHAADDHDWESCSVCIAQAKRDGILGPDAVPHA